jgi:KipI family sensor histidine kinase inhibitor
MVGFAPGLPYLGGLPAALHISRRETPRPRVPAGAVMIGGMQALIVPTPLASGWYTLGQTPLRPFDLRRPDPFLFRAGDRVRFRRIDAVEYARLATLASDALLPFMQVPA